MFNATFHNISDILWRSVLLVEETEVPGENHRPAVSHWQTLSHNVVSRTPRLSEIRTHNVSGDFFVLEKAFNSKRCATLTIQWQLYEGIFQKKTFKLVKKSLRIPEAVKRKTDNTTVKRKKKQKDNNDF